MNDIDRTMIELEMEKMRNKTALNIFKKQQQRALSKLHLSDRISIRVVQEDSIKIVHI